MQLEVMDHTPPTVSMGPPLFLLPSAYQLHTTLFLPTVTTTGATANKKFLASVTAVYETTFPSTNYQIKTGTFPLSIKNVLPVAASSPKGESIVNSSIVSHYPPSPEEPLQSILGTEHETSSTTKTIFADR